jgi:hypothetical protein
VVRAVVFARQQLCYPTAATLFGWLLPQQGWVIQFWVLPSVSWDQLWDPPPAPLWEVSLSPYPCFQSLLLFPHSFTESLALRVQLLAPPPLSQADSVFHPHLFDQCYITICYLCFAVLLGAGRGISLPRSSAGLCSQGTGKGVGHGMWCSLVYSADSCKQLWSQLEGKNGMLLLLARCSIRGFPCIRGPGCHRVWFWLMLYLLLAEGKKWKRNG